MALQEDERTNTWKKQDICIGSIKACAFPGLVSSYSKFIISFAEDETGNLFLKSYFPYLKNGVFGGSNSKKYMISTGLPKSLPWQN